MNWGKWSLHNDPNWNSKFLEFRTFWRSWKLHTQLSRLIKASSQAHNFFPEQDIFSLQIYLLLFYINSLHSLLFCCYSYFFFLLGFGDKVRIKIAVKPLLHSKTCRRTPAELIPWKIKKNFFWGSHLTKRKILTLFPKLKVQDRKENTCITSPIILSATKIRHLAWSERNNFFFKVLTYDLGSLEAN